MHSVFSLTYPRTHSSHFTACVTQWCWGGLNWLLDVLQCSSAAVDLVWGSHSSTNPCGWDGAAGRALLKHSHLSADPIRTVCCFFPLMSAFNSLQLFPFTALPLHSKISGPFLQLFIYCVCSKAPFFPLRLSHFVLIIYWTTKLMVIQTSAGEGTD